MIDRLYSYPFPASLKDIFLKDTECIPNEYVRYSILTDSIRVIPLLLKYSLRFGISEMHCLSLMVLRYNHYDL